MLEPTDNTIQAGCLGNLNAELVFRGESAHSARPWLGRNAIERAVEGLAPRPPASEPRGGRRRPHVRRGRDADADPGRHRVERRAGPRVLRRQLPLRAGPLAGRGRGAPPRARWTAVRRARRSPRTRRPARVATDSPLVEALARRRRPRGRAEAGLDAGRGVRRRPGFDAVNLGPGATAYAHRADEQVEIAELVRTFEALRRFLAGDSV